MHPPTSYAQTHAFNAPTTSTSSTNASLLSAIQTFDVRELRRYLRSNSADLNSRSIVAGDVRMTPLEYVVSIGFNEAIKPLVIKGASFGGAHPENILQTPLGVAYSTDNYDAFLELISRGADIDARDSKGKLLVTLTSQSELQSECKELLESLIFDKYFINKKARLGAIWRKCKKLNPRFNVLTQREQASVLVSALSSTNAGGLLNSSNNERNHVQSPTKTFSTLSGDCDDSCLLYANALSNLKFNPNDIKLAIFSGVFVSETAKPANGGHGIIILNLENQFFYADPINNIFLRLVASDFDSALSVATEFYTTSLKSWGKFNGRSYLMSPKEYFISHGLVPNGPEK